MPSADGSQAETYVVDAVPERLGLIKHFIGATPADFSRTFRTAASVASWW